MGGVWYAVCAQLFLITSPSNFFSSFLGYEGIGKIFAGYLRFLDI